MDDKTQNEPEESSEVESPDPGSPEMTPIGEMDPGPPEMEFVPFSAEPLDVVEIPQGEDTRQ